MDTTTLTMPFFHLNGSSAERLTEGYSSAYERLNEFVNYFNEIEFHPRDYYPLGDGEWLKAFKERDQIRNKISEIRQYLEAHIDHCYDNKK
jgi:hypothetical protein